MTNDEISALMRDMADYGCGDDKWIPTPEVFTAICDRALLADELAGALRAILYGPLDGEQIMSPEGDSVRAIYPAGTLERIRALLAKVKP